jgi:dienelactone hydrolase
MGASLAHRVAALDARFSRLLLLHGLFYRGGHLFTDPELPDHYPAAAAEAWARAERFLAG